MNDLPITCTLDNKTLQSRRLYLFDKMIDKTLEVKMLKSGCAFRFAENDAMLDTLLEVIKLERACCRFMQFNLTVMPDHGPVWLEVTGPDGTAEFIQQLLLEEPD